LIFEVNELKALIDIYKSSLYLPEDDALLPDAPIVRFLGWERGGLTPRLECLAGERRLTAASLAGRTTLPVRSVVMTDDDAYQFILAHNDVKPLTTIEFAYRAADMERLGFSHEQIQSALRGKGIHRYLDVGRWVDLTLLGHAPKLCDPSILVWHDAYKLGHAHFVRCLTHWANGEWDEETCNREFRRKGQVLPTDNAERGFRLTRDRDRLIIRGQIDLALHDVKTADIMVETLIEHLNYARFLLREDVPLFSDRKEVYQINPLTL
jgi:predicted GNAT family acetyltransferase